MVAVAAEPRSLRSTPDGSRIADVSGNRLFISAAFFGNIARSSLWTVDVDGGEPVPFTDSLHLYQNPVWIPDGRHLLFVSNRGEPRGIYCVRVSGSRRPQGKPKHLTNGLEAHSIDVAEDGKGITYSKYWMKRNEGCSAIATFV